MKLIDKDALVAEIKRKKLSHIDLTEFNSGYKNAIFDVLSFLDTIEVKDMSMPALDNGNMPVERWKEACEAASCQANYRKSKGWTETCDDYFVDGVQWADEHPIKMKRVDLDKELNDFIEEQKAWVKDDRVVEYNNGDSFNHIYDLETVAKHFLELGLKAKAENIWHDANKEEPKIGKAFATIDSKGVMCAEYHVFEGGLTFKQIKEMDNIVKWAYTEYLIPKD